MSRSEIPQILKTPNIILIMADDLGFNDLGCYGNDSISSPHLDRLAREGIQFYDFHSNGVVCSPTRASLLTGKYPQRTGISGVVTAKSHRTVGLPHLELTIAEHLKNLGYTTGITGKWHLGYDTLFSPMNQGFDQFTGFVSGNIDYQSHYDQENYFDWWQEKRLEDQPGYATDLITQNSIDFIEENKDNPFFLYVAHGAPHYPYQVRNSESFRGPDWNGIVNPGTVSEKKKIYKEMIDIMDEGIGQIMDFLEENNLARNTLIFFLSDNGASSIGSNHPLRGHKGQVWEGGHRVPAIAYWKGKIKPSTSSDLILSMDIFPTILDAIHMDNVDKPDMDGKSFYPVLEGTHLKEKRTVFWKFNNGSAVRKAKWKLIKEGKECSLFNLEEDIGEQENLKDSFPERFKELQKELETWEQEMSQYPEIS